MLVVDWAYGIWKVNKRKVNKGKVNKRKVNRRKVTKRKVNNRKETSKRNLFSLRKLQEWIGRYFNFDNYPYRYEIFIAGTTNTRLRNRGAWGNPENNKWLIKVIHINKNVL